MIFINLFCMFRYFRTSGYREGAPCVSIEKNVCRTGEYAYSARGGSTGNRLLYKPDIIFLLRVSILHIAHFAGLDLDKLRYREHCHIRIPMSAAILLRCAVPVPE